MIVLSNLVYDMGIHFVIFLVIFAFARYAARISVVYAALYATIFITILNHVFFPKLTLRKMLKD
jgi:hypothetical protein